VWENKTKDAQNILENKSLQDDMKYTLKIHIKHCRYKKDAVL